MGSLEHAASSPDGSGASPLICRRGKWRSAGTLLVALLLMALGAGGFAITKSDEVAIRILSGGLFILGILFLLLALWRLCGTSTVAIFSEEGVRPMSLKFQLIPWDDIQEIAVRVVPAGYTTVDFMCITLKDKQKYLAGGSRIAKAMTRLNQVTGYGDVVIPFAMVRPRSEEALLYIGERLNADVVILARDEVGE